MRVLLVAGTFPPGRCGVGDYTARLAEALARSGEMVVGVLTQRTAAAASATGVEVLATARSWRLWELPALLGRIRGWRPDLIHIHYPSQGFGWRLLPALLPALCKAFGFRVVQTWHEPWPMQDSHRFLLQRMATDGLLFVRPDYVALMPPLLRRFMPSCPTRTIGSAGALPASRMSEEERRQLRQRHLAGRQFLVVFFGFVHPAKGVEQLFEIADPLTHSLVIAGGILDNAYRKQLEDVAAVRGWKEQIHYTGYLEQEDAADLIAAADAVVLPFLQGGGEWNTSIHGALAQGTLVITTARAGFGDDPVRNLYTAAVSDVQDMSFALRTLAGRRMQAVPQEGWGAVARAHADFYQQILRNR
jgi:glycosyltransferase involved in cell wall biosynthesis